MLNIAISTLTLVISLIAAGATVYHAIQSESVSDLEPSWFGLSHSVLTVVSAVFCILLAYAAGVVVAWG